MDENGRIPRSRSRGPAGADEVALHPRGPDMPGNAVPAPPGHELVTPQVFSRGGRWASGRPRDTTSTSGSSGGGVPGRLRHVHDRGPGDTASSAALAPPPRAGHGGVAIEERSSSAPAAATSGPLRAALRTRPRHAPGRRVELHRRGLQWWTDGSSPPGPGSAVGPDRGARGRHHNLAPGHVSGRSHDQPGVPGALLRGWATA
jgi:hypothetical protein